MATKSSGNLDKSATYTLGEYTFRIERKSISGSSNDQVDAICRKSGGKNARKSVQIPSNASIRSWYVEANDTTADVYIEYDGDYKRVDKVFSGGPVSIVAKGVTTDLQCFIHCAVVNEQSISTGPFWVNVPFVSQVPQTVHYEGTQTGNCALTDRTLGLYSGWYNAVGSASQNYGLPVYVQGSHEAVISQYTYTTPERESEVILVGRFPIKLEDAGGVGPGSDWDDPGDYDDDRDPEDPTTTLYLTVEGALSGRHNDPLNDTSYSYLPYNKDTKKEYGCGGDGGNGGGGGAGAANVVVFKFATNEADHKDIATIAKRHGYGSGGGKGGKGGPGCILIYY